MKTIVHVQLKEGDNFLYDAAGAAAQVIAALGGDPTNDYCTVNIVQPIDQGTAGSSPAAADARAAAG